MHEDPFDSRTDSETLDYIWSKDLCAEVIAELLDLDAAYLVGTDTYDMFDALYSAKGYRYQYLWPAIQQVMNRHHDDYNEWATARWDNEEDYK